MIQTRTYKYNNYIHFNNNNKVDLVLKIIFKKDIEEELEYLIEAVS